MSTSSEDFFNNGRIMTACIERGTCACIIDATIISVTIGASTSIHWVNTHEGRGSRIHVFIVSFSMCDTLFISHVRNPSNVSLYNTSSVIVILAYSL